jgi:hypothetical protein
MVDIPLRMVAEVNAIIAVHREHFAKEAII